MAVKLSSVTRDGKWQDVYKDPITDPGKYSKRGRFRVSRDERGKIVTAQINQGEDMYENNLLQPVFRNGSILRFESFTDIRARAKWEE